LQDTSDEYIVKIIIYIHLYSLVGFWNSDLMP